MEVYSYNPESHRSLIHNLTQEKCHYNTLSVVTAVEMKADPVADSESKNPHGKPAANHAPMRI
jgi:hypothetical protein